MRVQVTWMVRWAAVFSCAVGGVGCGDAQGGDFECERSDREGVYVVQYDEKSYKDMAMCGAIADTLGPPDDPSAVAADWGPCRLESSDWFQGDCRREFAYGCVATQASTNIATSLVATTYQKDADGDLIEGLLTRIVHSNTDGTVCRSSYDMTARRQR